MVVETVLLGLIRLCLLVRLLLRSIFGFTADVLKLGTSDVSLVRCPSFMSSGI
tara:strand:- start:293 stop:451 length:159 start_codon:yes stop_codon:yes gene_type:complete